MTSPPLIDPSAIQVCGLIEFFMKWTEPSPKRVLTPPGCRLREPPKAAPSDDELKQASICTGWLSQSSPGWGGLWPTPVTNASHDVHVDAAVQEVEDARWA